MHDEQSFIRAICENPADATLRLVFCDWLEENGQEGRAHLIRTHFHQNYPPDDIDTARRMIGPSYSMCPNLLDSMVIRKGFVREIRLKADAFVQYAEVLFSHHPIEEVRLTDRIPGPYVEHHSHHYWYLKQRRPAGYTGPVDMEHWLVGELFDIVFHHPNVLPEDAGGYGRVASFKSVELAHSALSEACVAYGRRKVGLPPLPTT